MNGKVIAVDFTRKHLPEGALARHPELGICPIVEAEGLYRLVEVVSDGDDYDWFKRRIERVPVQELEEIPLTQA